MAQFHVKPSTVLDELVIGHLFHPLMPEGIRDQHANPRDFRLDMMDAVHEDVNGFLPHQPEYGQPQIISEPVLDLIPAWVIADARDMRVRGMSIHKIARAILCVTECEDLASCEETLSRCDEIFVESSASEGRPNDV